MRRSRCGARAAPVGTACPSPPAVSASLLAIDSSTERLALALQWGGRAWTVEEAGGAQASARIVPQLMSLLEQAGATLQALDAIGFARGPGAFTGLRTACAVAQGLAFGAGRPVLPLDSLLVVAEDARAASGAEAGFEVWVATDARMGEVYAGRYAWRGDRWDVLAAPALYELDALHARWQGEPPRVVAGSALAAFGERLSTQGAACHPAERSRAEALLRVAQQAWRRGEAVDADQALPLYLRDKVALTTAEREALRTVEALR
jgi:tRNA threonylcarbamoyladenosine biosynthesis protein TsaB